MTQGMTRTTLFALMLVGLLLFSSLLAPKQAAWEELKLAPPEWTALQTAYDPQTAATLAKAVVIDPTYSHACEEHPESCEVVRACFEKNGAYIQFQIWKNMRYLRVCLFDDGKTIGFQIVDIVGKVAKERTAYIKEGITTIKDLFEYAAKNKLIRFTKPF